MRDLLASQGTAVDTLDSSTVLFGREGYLDSLGLVSLVVSTEQALQDELNLTVSLADEKALSQRHSPYRTVGSLADYAVSSI
jgi:acyl carrier protein